MKHDLELANSRIHRLERQLAAAIHTMRRHHIPEEDVDPFVDVFQWKLIASGGNVRPGVLGNLGHCPCQHEYTVATNQAVIGAWPNAGAVNNCAANLPAAAAAEWNCREDCVQVMTQIWHGWDVVQNVKTGVLKFNCMRFAQYHCKSPGDPEGNRPPRPTDPNDPAPKL